MPFIKLILSLCLVLILTTPATAHGDDDSPFFGNLVTYQDGDTTLEGYWSPSQCESVNKKRPTIIILHQWMGLSDHEKMKADKFASQCYNVLAADIYGKDVRPKNKEEAQIESSKFKKHPVRALNRVGAAIEKAKTYPNVATNHIVVIGYSFGGGLALDLARSGADIDAAINFYGNLNTRWEKTDPKIIKAKIEVHNGKVDTYIPERHINRFKDEMAATSTSWNYYTYENAVHGFDQVHAGNDPSLGIAYNKAADELSWERTLEFLKKLYGGEEFY